MCVHMSMYMGIMEKWKLSVKGSGIVQRAVRQKVMQRCGRVRRFLEVPAARSKHNC